MSLERFAKKDPEPKQTVFDRITNAIRDPRLPRKAALILAGLLVAASVTASNGRVPLSPMPSEASFSPSPVPTLTETASPTPTSTETPTMEPTPTPVAPLNNMPPIPTPEKQSLVWKAGDVIKSGPDDGTIYLTFDDCFDADLTKKLIIDAYGLGVPLALFCIGTAIDNPQQAENMKLAIAYGDELENHTFNHAALDTTDSKFITMEIDGQLQILRKDLGDPNYKEYFVRPAGGLGAGNPLLWNIAASRGMKVASWSCDSKGYQHAYDTSDASINLTVDTINKCLVDKNGNFVSGQVIVQHIRASDVLALSKIVQEIRNKGGRFGLLCELVGCASDGTTAVKVSPYLVIYYPEVVAGKPEEELMAA